MAKGDKIEAYGTKGMKSDQWRRTFKHEDHLNDWAEKNDAQIQGTRDLEGAKQGVLRSGRSGAKSAVNQDQGD